MRASVADFKSSGGLRTIVEGEPDDLILVAYSFEPRSSTIVQNLADDYVANLGVVYANAEILKLEKRSGDADVLDYNEMGYRLAARCNAIRQAKGSLQKPSVQLESLQGIFARKGFDSDSVKRITVDATAFNRETLLILFGLLDTYFPGAKKRVVYVSPAKYGDWLSAGFQKVRNIIGLAGLQDPSRKTMLVVLYGFEHHRALKALEEYEPSKVLIGSGSKPTEVDFLKRNLEELDKVQMKLALSQQEVDYFQFPADSITACAARLEEVVAPFVDDFNIVVAPMSTKLSTIASYLLAKNYPQIQISYCVPGEYNIESYSDGAKTVFAEELILP
jgi:hypothetical protein